MNIFNFKRPEYERWDLAAQEFKSRVLELSIKLLGLIQQARVDDKDFKGLYSGIDKKDYHGELGDD
ncbi:hypothetical protein PN36_13825 [Candidatus Thiomargarita nelsonii]|uniref:Uncharacterized protein n=1 Tax=Candidatus Thiomargarita nelsonii TaxID=1003181 RepID=A0A0A6P8H9_9GAMM|nr:hypothetical protein PN36_13825 [Candidatus Thiomargarita nelsonii]